MERARPFRSFRFFKFVLPLTTDIPAFYFNAIVFSAVLILNPAVYGFYNSIAGQQVA